jgi:hypothetical protein
MNLRRVCFLAFALTAFVAITFGQGFPVGDNPAPTITSVLPTSAMRLQTLNVVIQGTNFVSSVTIVDFGAYITVNSVVINSSTELIANITVGSSVSLGARNVAVFNALPGGGVAVLTNGFLVGINPNLVPALISLSPNTARRLDRLDLTFSGTNFISGVTSIDLGPEIVINSVTVESSTRVIANVTVSATAALGLRNVYVTNAPPGGGSAELVGAFTVTNAPEVSVSGPAGVPTAFGLEQNYPNPFNPSTTIRYGLPQNSFVKLAVYNMLGEQVAVLQNGEQEAGYHEVEFNGEGLSSGVYFYRMQSGVYVETKKLILTR